jgi:hypothetical protein
MKKTLLVIAGCIGLILAVRSLDLIGLFKRMHGM